MHRLRVWASSAWSLAICCSRSFSPLGIGPTKATSYVPSLTLSTSGPGGRRPAGRAPTMTGRRRHTTNRPTPTPTTRHRPLFHPLPLFLPLKSQEGPALTPFFLQHPPPASPAQHRPFLTCVRLFPSYHAAKGPHPWLLLFLRLVPRAPGSASLPHQAARKGSPFRRVLVLVGEAGHRPSGS